MHTNCSVVKELAIKRLPCLHRSLNIAALKSDPHMSVWILLDKDSINFAKIAANVHHLIFYVNKVRGVFSQVNHCWIKHSNKEKAGGWRLRQNRHKGILRYTLIGLTFCSLLPLRTRYHRRISLSSQFLHQCHSLLSILQIRFLRVFSEFIFASGLSLGQVLLG